MRICLRNNPVQFHSDPIWNDKAFILRMLAQQEQEEEKNKMTRLWDQFLIQKAAGAAIPHHL